MKKTGDDYFDSEEFRDLLEQYETSRSTGMPVFLDADELTEIANYYQMIAQPDEAEEAIELALSLSPDATDPIFYRVREALFNGDIEQAQEWFSKIQDTNLPDYIYVRAEILIVQERIEEADQYLREQLKTIPPDEYQDYVIDVASIYQDYGQSEMAMQWVARAKQEDTPQFKELIARTLFGLGKYEESEKLFNELIDTDPYSKAYWKGLASAQFMREDYSGAMQSNEYAIAIDPQDAEGLLGKANSLSRLNNYEGALDYYKRYSELVPDDEFSYLNQGTCLINMERNDEAIIALDKALSLALPDSPYLCDIYQELAFAYSDSGHADRALELLDQTDSLECDHIQTLVVRGHIMLADGRIEEAEKYFHKAVVQSSTPNQTIMRVIISIYDNKYHELSYKLFKRFFNFVPADFNEGYAYMALVCYDLKKADEFMQYLKTACERNPRECKLALGHIFPDTVEPQNYYSYLKEKMKQQ